MREDSLLDAIDLLRCGRDATPFSPAAVGPDSPRLLSIHVNPWISLSFLDASASNAVIFFSSTLLSAAWALVTSKKWVASSSYCSLRVFRACLSCSTVDNSISEFSLLELCLAAVTLSKDSLAVRFGDEGDGVIVSEAGGEGGVVPNVLARGRL